ncbi:MAG: ABC transporter ATP-binding protein [Xanthomonadales bacterium]|nr:ABC transporter ATP-binding protein [Xanthomonadales bacterium]
MQLSLNTLSKRYADRTVLHGVSLQLDAGEIGCVLGPSGCGKTTLLRLIAGFDQPDTGAIRTGETILSSAETHVPAERRRIGMVFQDHALLPHLDVASNVAFGLRHLTRAERHQRVTAVLELVGLQGYETAYPHALSGGQAQRVALARSLAPEPKMILLDEPFSNLDTELRERLSQEVREILKRAGMTALMVTHDQLEAFAMADRIAVMSAGVLQQWDTPYNLYHRPANRFVARFVGEGVLLPGRADGDDGATTELGLLRGEWVGAPVSDVDVLLRPDDIEHDDASPQQAVVVRKAFRGAQILYTLQLDSGARVLSLVPSHHNHRIGEPIGIRVATDHVVVFPRNSDSS